MDNWQHLLRWEFQNGIAVNDKDGGDSNAKYDSLKGHEEKPQRLELPNAHDRSVWMFLVEKRGGWYVWGAGCFVIIKEIKGFVGEKLF